jgi:hypothetical protein
MKLLLIALMLTSGYSYASCDLTLPNHAFYQCVEKQNWMQQQSQRLQRIEEQNKEILTHQLRFPNSTVPMSCYFDFGGVRRCF